MILYGRNAVKEALGGCRHLKRLWVTRRLAGEQWVDAAREDGTAVEVAARAELDALCGSEDHQGVAAKAEPYPYAELDDLFRTPDALIVALDEVQDPQNLGAVIRVAECVGAAGVIVPEHRSARVTAAVCRASAGAVEHIEVARVKNLARALAMAKRQGAWVYGASPDARFLYTEPDYEGSIVVVMGSEGRGLRPTVAAACDMLVRIPLAGRIDSLNVATAAAALLFEIKRTGLT